MKVLLSIKPEYALKIFEGKKRFEFRKIIFKRPEIKTVIVYATSPMKLVIGEFEIEDIITTDPDNLWKQTKKYSGITQDFFFEYFANRKVAHAIKIKNIKKYEQPLNIKKNFNVHPPQSYVYL